VLAFAFALGGEFAEKSQDNKKKKFKFKKPQYLQTRKAAPYQIAVKHHFSFV